MLRLASRSTRRGGECRGLTLVELIVVLALLGLAMLASLPSISDWMRSMSLRSSAEAIKAGVERARMEALRRNTSMGFWLVSDASTGLTSSCALSANGFAWVVSVDDPTGLCATAPSASVSPRLADSWTPGRASASLQVSATDANGNSASSIQFNSLGQVQAGGLSAIDVTSVGGAATALRVVVNSGGSVRLCQPSAASSDPRAC